MHMNMSSSDRWTNDRGRTGDGMWGTSGIYRAYNCERFAQSSRHRNVTPMRTLPLFYGSISTAIVFDCNVSSIIITSQFVCERVRACVCVCLCTCTCVSACVLRGEPWPFFDVVSPCVLGLPLLALSPTVLCLGKSIKSRYMVAKFHFPLLDYCEQVFVFFHLLAPSCCGPLDLV